MRRFMAPLGTAFLAVLAFAGTPCPNPLSAQIVDGRCAATQCNVPRSIGPGTVLQDGYVATNPSTRQGECRSPGTNSVECIEAIQQTSYTYGDQSGTGYNCTNGQYLSSVCDEVSKPYTRIDGRNSGTPCDYCGSNNN